MTVLPELLPLAVDMMSKKVTGTINLTVLTSENIFMNRTNPGVITHNEILELYQSNVDSSHKWTNFTISILNLNLVMKNH